MLNAVSLPLNALSRHSGISNTQTLKKLASFAPLLDNALSQMLTSPSRTNSGSAESASQIPLVDVSSIIRQSLCKKPTLAQIKSLLPLLQQADINKDGITTEKEIKGLENALKKQKATF